MDRPPKSFPCHSLSPSEERSTTILSFSLQAEDAHKMHQCKTLKNGTASVAVQPQKCSSSCFHFDGVVTHLCDLHNALPPCECCHACGSTVLGCVARHCNLFRLVPMLLLLSHPAIVSCWHWHWIHRLHIVLSILHWYCVNLCDII